MRKRLKRHAKAFEKWNRIVRSWSEDDRERSRAHSARMSSAENGLVNAIYFDALLRNDPRGWEPPECWWRTRTPRISDVATIIGTAYSSSLK